MTDLIFDRLLVVRSFGVKTFRVENRRLTSQSYKYLPKSHIFDLHATQNLFSPRFLRNKCEVCAQLGKQSSTGTTQISVIQDGASTDRERSSTENAVERDEP